MIGYVYCDVDMWKDVLVKNCFDFVEIKLIRVIDFI